MGGVHVPQHGKRPRSEQERCPLSRVAELPLDLFGFFLERENAEIEVPHLAPGEDEGEKDKHDVERRVAAPLILEHFRPDESGSARSCKLERKILLVQLYPLPRLSFFIAHTATGHQ